MESFLVAGVGFFIALPSRIVVARRSQAPSFNSLLGGVSLRENAAPRRFRLLTHVLLRRPWWQFKISTSEQKKETNPIGLVSFFWLRGWDLNLTASGL